MGGMCGSHCSEDKSPRQKKHERMLKISRTGALNHDVSFRKRVSVAIEHVAKQIARW
jgi:hypothetical protein